MAVPHNFDQINTSVLQPLCANFSTCHSKDGETDAGKMDLSDDPYDALVGVPATNPMAMSQGLLRVKPCDPDNSFMWTKLNLPEIQDLGSGDGTGGMIVGYGASMPKDNPHLPPELLTALHDWIARGAHQFESVDVTGTACVTDDASLADLSPSD